MRWQVGARLKFAIRSLGIPFTSNPSGYHLAIFYIHLHPFYISNFGRSVFYTQIFYCLNLFKVNSQLQHAVYQPLRLPPPLLSRYGEG